MRRLVHLQGRLTGSNLDLFEDIVQALLDIPQRGHRAIREPVDITLRLACNLRAALGDELLRLDDEGTRLVEVTKRLGVENSLLRINHLNTS
jgi:hypothetical protein